MLTAVFFVLFSTILFLGLLSKSILLLLESPSQVSNDFASVEEQEGMQCRNEEVPVNDSLSGIMSILSSPLPSILTLA